MGCQMTQWRLISVRPPSSGRISTVRGHLTGFVKNFKSRRRARNVARGLLLMTDYHVASRQRGIDAPSITSTTSVSLRARVCNSSELLGHGGRRRAPAAALESASVDARAVFESPHALSPERRARSPAASGASRTDATSAAGTTSYAPSTPTGDERCRVACSSESDAALSSPSVHPAARCRRRAALPNVGARLCRGPVCTAMGTSIP